MWLMVQQETPDDFVIATGECHSLEEFVAAAFAQVDLDWRELEKRELKAQEERERRWRGHR
jgi:GDP-D-mannose dehydratase